MPRLPKLRWHRERQALSQEELARAAGVSRGTITRIEGGEDTHPQTARKIAAALGVSPAELMEDEVKEAA
jgi:transcriptional regulator with XRE-family HTH domain